YGLKLTDRTLKPIGLGDLKERDLDDTGKKQVQRNLEDYLAGEAQKSLQGVDLKDGAKFLEADWGLKSLADWAKQKFQLKLAVEDLKDKEENDLRVMLRRQVRALYRGKDEEFPVQYGLASFMADRGQHGVSA